MFFNEAANSWLVGTGKYDLTIGAVAMSDAVQHASFRIFNGNPGDNPVFNADETGNVTASGAITGSTFRTATNDFVLVRILARHM
jgi:hypothetical protein